MKTRYVIIVILSTLLYLPSIFGGFMWDDEDIITGDYTVHSMANAGKIFAPQYWKRSFPGAENRYRPLRSLLFMGEWKAFGRNPAGYHAVNIALNAAAACLALWLSFLFFKDPDKAFVAALFFAVHPAHVESVAWLKNVTDILMFGFAALAAVVFLKNAETEEHRPLRIAAGLALFLLALAGKEGAVMLPALLFCWLVMLNGARPAAAFRKTGVVWALGAAFLFFAVYFLRRSPGLAAFDLKSSLLAFAQYSRLVFLPFGLNADRDLVTAVDALGPLLGAGLAVYFYRTREKAGLYALLWIFLWMVPFLDMRFVTGRPIAEQRLYSSVLGLGLVCGVFYRPDRLRQYLLGGICLLFGALTLARNFDWLEPVRFWEKTVAASPASARARNNLGVSYERAGRAVEAASAYSAAINLAPGEEVPYLNMADLLYKSGRVAEAERVYSEVYSKKPDSGRAMLGLMKIFLKTGRTGETIKLAGTLLSSDPGNSEALNSMGVAEMLLGRNEEAEKALEKAIKLNPEYVEAYYNLAGLYRAAGRLDLAAAAYGKLLVIAPAHPDALNNLAILSDMAGNEARAIELFKRAEAASPGFYQASYNLGGIYYRKKMYIDALSEYTRVLAADPGHVQAGLKAKELRKLINENNGK